MANSIDSIIAWILTIEMINEFIGIAFEWQYQGLSQGWQTIASISGNAWSRPRTMFLAQGLSSRSKMEAADAQWAGFTYSLCGLILAHRYLVPFGLWIYLNVQIIEFNQTLDQQLNMDFINTIARVRRVGSVPESDPIRWDVTEAQPMASNCLIGEGLSMLTRKWVFS